jgi:hypothetical protein
MFHSMFFFSISCDVAKVATIHVKILTKFVYKLSMKVEFFKTSSLYLFLDTY